VIRGIRLSDRSFDVAECGDLEQVAGCAACVRQTTSFVFGRPSLKTHLFVRRIRASIDSFCVRHYTYAIWHKTGRLHRDDCLIPPALNYDSRMFTTSWINSRSRRGSKAAVRMRAEWRCCCCGENDAAGERARSGSFNAYVSSSSGGGVRACFLVVIWTRQPPDTDTSPTCHYRRRRQTGANIALLAGGPAGGRRLRIRRRRRRLAVNRMAAWELWPVRSSAWHKSRRTLKLSHHRCPLSAYAVDDAQTVESVYDLTLFPSPLGYRIRSIVFVMPPPPIGGALSDDAVWRLFDVCLSVAYIGPKSRTERPRKTKIGTEVAHATRDWEPRASSGVVRMDPLRFMAGCRTRRLNQG